MRVGGERDHGRSWRTGVAVGEGVRSALAWRWLSALLVLLVCWVGASSGALDAVTVARLVADEQRFLDAGGSVVIVENHEAGVPAAGCEQLAHVDGVYGSAALTHVGEPATVSGARGGDLPVFAASGDLWRLLRVEGSDSRSGIVSAAFAARLGWVDGDWVQFERSPGTRGEWLPTSPMRITVADTRILGDEYTGVIFPAVATVHGTADACVIAADPARLPALVGALPAVLATGYGQVVVRDRLITGEFAADYSGAYHERPLRWAWAVAGGLLGMVWFLLRWMRRSDDALYATMGADAVTRLVIRGTEWFVVAGLGGGWAIVLGVVTAMVADAPFSLAATYVTRHVVAALLTATAVVLLVQARRPRSVLADLKDR